MIQNTTAQAGILVIDKPLNMTSHDVVGRVRHLTDMRRVGHTGTLDPLASGILLVALGTATRLIQFSHDNDKTYEAEFTLGATSTTDDAGGIIATQSVEKEPTLEDVTETAKRFIGDIEQMPPSYAAIKVKGKKLYEYARAGETVTVEPRKVTIHSIEILKYVFPKISVRVKCGTGTYIRSLAKDIGETLGTGAYVTALRRTQIGTLGVEQSVPLEKLSTDNVFSHLLPPETLVSHLPKITLTNDNVAKWKQGRAILYQNKTEQLPKHSPLGVFDESGKLCGIGTFDEATSLLSPTIVLVQ